jgi:hypothetical protein
MKKEFKKNKRFYNFLREVDFCTFGQFEKSLKATNKREMLNSAISFTGKKQKEVFIRKEYQQKFSKLMNECFDQ